MPIIPNQKNVKYYDPDDIHEEFDKFWNISEHKALSEIVTSEHLDQKKDRLLIESYLYTEREPLRDDILDLRIEGRPSTLKSKEISDRILNKIFNFIDTFMNGLSGI